MMHLKGCGRNKYNLFQVLFKHVPGMTDKNYEKSQSS